MKSASASNGGRLVSDGFNEINQQYIKPLDKYNNKYLKSYENTKAVYLQEEEEKFSAAAQGNIFLAAALGVLNLVGVFKLFQIFGQPGIFIKFPQLMIVSKVSEVRE